jgi:hypothetical protein
MTPVQSHPLPPTRRILTAPLLTPVGLALAFAGGLLGWRCEGGVPLLFHALSLAGLLLALFAARRCWRLLQQSDAVWRAGGGRDARQARFIALGVTVLACTVVGMVAMTWLQLTMLDPCAVQSPR